MKHNLVWSILIFIAVLCFSIYHKSTSKITTPYSVVYLQQAPMSETIQERGLFVPMEQKKVFSKISGQIEKIPITLGQTVSKNQGLLTLHASEITHQLNQAIFKLKAEKLTIKSLQKQINDKRNLAKKNIISLEDFNQLETTLAQHELSRDAQTETIIHLKTIQKQHEIASEIGGIVSSIYVNEGQLIQAGTHLMTIESTKRLKIDVFIKEYEAHKIVLKQNVTISSPLFNDAVIQGHISMIVPVISTEKHNEGMRIEITLNDDLQSFNIYPGNQIDITIQTAYKKDSVTLPLTAVHQSGNEYSVTLASDLSKRKVTVGIQNRNRIEIRDGLNKDEGVIDGLMY